MYLSLLKTQKLVKLQEKVKAMIPKNGARLVLPYQGTVTFIPNKQPTTTCGKKVITKNVNTFITLFRSLLYAWVSDSIC